jgi:hypothetical protein
MFNEVVVACGSAPPVARSRHAITYVRPASVCFHFIPLGYTFHRKCG